MALFDALATRAWHMLLQNATDTQGRVRVARRVQFGMLGRMASQTCLHNAQRGHEPYDQTNCTTEKIERSIEDCDWRGTLGTRPFTNGGDDDEVVRTHAQREETGISLQIKIL